MGKPLQIREVPDPVLEILRERADDRHMSLAAYALEVLVEHVQRPTMAGALSGPRRGRGPAPTNREILGILQAGRP